MKKPFETAGDMSILEDVRQISFGSQMFSVELLDALRLRLNGEAPHSVLEVCQEAGQLSLLIAAILQDIGKGTLTTFVSDGRSGEPAITEHIASLGLGKHLTLLPAGRSYTWALKRLLASHPRPQFDVCIFNGHKSWEASGFGVLLADMLLRRGGLMIMMNAEWSMANSPYFKARPAVIEKYSGEELSAKPIQLAADLILPHLGYDSVEAPELRSMVLARKL